MIGTVKGIGGSAWIPHVGYVWKSADPTSPAELYQGTTWAKIKDRTILAAGDTYTTGATGGSATHTLTVDEIPSHSHTGSTSSAGAHIRYTPEEPSFMAEESTEATTHIRVTRPRRPPEPILTR